MQPHTHQICSQHRARRGGAVIILSLALLMSLLFLGLFFFSFVDDESRSADIYARQAAPRIAVSNEHVLNHGLSQVVVGPNDSNPDEPYFAPYTALFGGRYSLLAHLLGPIGEHDWDYDFRAGPPFVGDPNGTNAEPPNADGYDEDIDDDGYFDTWTPTDAEPYSGRGVRVYFDSMTSTYLVDTNNDGVADNDVTGLWINASPLAVATSYDPLLATNRFEADAGYTYPDLNSLPLYHEVELWEDDNLNGILDAGEDRDGDGVLSSYIAIKPSFEAPGILAAPGGYAYPTQATEFTAQHLLRPHAAHAHAGGSRYLGSNVTLPGGRTVTAFETNYLFDPNQRYGVWNNSGTHPSGYGYDFHADANGDGENDAFLVDQDYPLVQFPDGREGVPLFYWRIEDADALVNLNTAGDMPLYRLAERRAASPVGRGQLVTALGADSRFLTASNYGLSPSEINPGVPLYADPGDSNFVDGSNGPLALDQFQHFHIQQSGSGSPAFDRLRVANTELWWLLTGRHQYDSMGNFLPVDYDVAGRYGEETQIEAGSGLLAAAGNTGSFFNGSQQVPFDDDGDSNVGRRPNGGPAYRELFPRKNGTPQVVPPVTMPPAVHPLDGGGFGVALTGAPGTDAGQRRRHNSNAGVAANPSQWLQYGSVAVPQFGGAITAISTWQFPVAVAAGVAPWFSAGNFLVGRDANPANSSDLFWDEPDELIVDDSDPNFANPADKPFAPSEMTGLHASDADWTRLNSTSRVRDLAPVNFTINYLAEQIRRQFTTVSWDRPEFSVRDDGFRVWEIGDWVPSTASVREFPPQFGTVNATRPDYDADLDPTTPPNIVGNDPLRPELRKLLYVDFQSGPGGNVHPMARLQLNGILSDDSLLNANGVSCFDANGNPRFRPLVPHPEFQTGDTTFSPSPMIHGYGSPVPHVFTSIGANTTAGRRAQEWWARYDRQRLARDIYTMLWMLGSKPDINNDGTVNANDSPVSANRYTVANGYPDNDSNGRSDIIDEMAQFAVNVVDAMDHDSVITKFEYDVNLADGWSNTPGAFTYGVESQILSLSEALWIKSMPVPSSGGGGNADHYATLYDDSQMDERQFLFIELRNVLPFTVNFEDDTWRVSRYPVGQGPLTGTPAASITFQSGGGKFVGPGNNFLIGAHDGAFDVVGGPDAGKDQAAIFWLDHNVDGTTVPMGGLDYFPLVPYLDSNLRPQGMTLGEAQEDYPNPTCDLDLCHERDINTNSFFESTNTVGYFLSGLVGTSTSQFDIVLERRQTLQGLGKMSADNDWVEVDRITVNDDTFQIPDNTASHTDVRNQFRNLRSDERREPLFAANDADGVVPYTGSNWFLRHTLGGPDITDSGDEPFGANPSTGTPVAAPNAGLAHQRNSVLPNNTRFQIWQPHFDRGFTSVYDLLSVTVLRPETLIYHDRTAGSVEGGLVEVGQTRLRGVHTAGVRFLNPQPALPAELAGVQLEHYENRWYRLLEFLTVPSHTSDEVADEMNFRRRVPGKVNLNTLRHEHVLGAVINDPNQLTLADSYVPTDDRFSTSPQRNWYLEMRRARDGVNPNPAFTMAPPIMPPGTPFASPFRPLSFDDPLNTADPLASTILRRGVDPGTSMTGFDTIGLLEARDPGDITTDQIDYHTRHRILSKIANLTTNRSHVYVIFGGFQFHEAYDANAGGNFPQVRIGARMNDIPAYRELIVVDMSRTEEAFDAATGAFDFRGFILHREVLP